MRTLLTILTFVLVQPLKAQNNELIRLTLSDKTNFRIMSTFTTDKKMPAHFFVFDTTMTWEPERFYLKGFDSLDRAPSWDEHHPYWHTYLFRDSGLNGAFSMKERMELLRKATGLRSRKIALRTPLASTISSYKSVKTGFIAWITDPVYSSDGRFAFIDVTIFDKQKKDMDIRESYHSKVCIIYKREGRGWRRWKLREHLIL